MIKKEVLITKYSLQMVVGIFNLMKSFNCSIYHYLLQKFKYCDNVLSKLSCLLFEDDDICYHS